MANNYYKDQLLKIGVYFEYEKPRFEADYDLTIRFDMCGKSNHMSISENQLNAIYEILKGEK